MEKNTNPVTTHIQEVKEEEIKKFFDDGVKLQRMTASMTELIKRDFFHRDKKANTSQLTDELDRILDSEDPRSRERIVKVKKFVRKQLQTIIKSKPTQQVLLGDKVDTRSVTMKKVTKPMIANEDGRFVGNFNELDEGKFRIVEERKPEKVEDDILTALYKFIDKHESDTTEMRDLLNEIDAGVMAKAS